MSHRTSVGRGDHEGGGVGVALAALVHSPDIDLNHVLAQLLTAAVDELGAAAAAILVCDGAAGLSLLATTSHDNAYLDTVRVQRVAGPCVEAIETGATVRAAGAVLEGRWPELARTMATVSLGAIEVFPLRWHGQVLGGLSVFHQDVSAPPAAIQAYADAATILIVQSAGLTTDARSRLRAALASREVIEMAKGVLAFQEELDMGMAYQQLQRISTESGVPLTETALAVVRRRGAPRV